MEKPTNPLASISPKDGAEIISSEILAKTITPAGPLDIKLPSGKTAKMRTFKGRDIREAQKLADGDSSRLIFAIIALTTEIDGAPVLMEDLDEMDGFDVFELYGKFGTNFTSAPSK